MPASRRALGVGEVILFLFFAPIALLGLVWLAVGTWLPSIAVSTPMPWWSWKGWVTTSSHEIPHIPGWRISVTLNPAQETSGDFFDLIPLPDGKLGLVIAVVVDKGEGAVL